METSPDICRGTLPKTYDGDRLIAEKFGDKYLLFHYDENDSIFATYNNGSSSYTYQLLKNLQGDVVAILNAANSVIATYEYDAWGNLLSIKNEYGNDITSSTGYFANINPIRYRGYYYDVETGFYYLKSRYYDPANARFISADSLLAIDPANNGMNLFAYCGNDPVNNVDPSGYYSWSEFKKDAKGFFCGIGETVVGFGNAVVDLGDAFFSSFSLDLEFGFGFGRSVNAFDVVEIDATIVPYRESVELTVNERKNYRESEFSIRASLFDAISVGPSKEYKVDLDGPHGTYGFYSNPNGIYETKDIIEFNKVEFGSDSTISIGYERYFLIGGGFELSFDYKKFINELN